MTFEPALLVALNTLFGDPVYVMGTATGHKEYAIELVRQLEIVIIRNPQLAQYVR